MEGTWTDQARYQSKKALYPLRWERRHGREPGMQECQGEGADTHPDAMQPSGKQETRAPAESQGKRISHSHEAPCPGWVGAALRTVIQQPGRVPPGVCPILRRGASTWGAVWEASPAGLEAAHTTSAYTAPVRPNRPATPNSSLAKVVYLGARDGKETGFDGNMAVSAIG